MKETKKNPYLTSVGIGLVAAMRTLSAPALVAHQKHAQSEPIFQMLASLEMLADKLPTTPNRVSPIQWVARAGSGGFSAAYALEEEDSNQSRWIHGLIGSASAIAATYILFHARKTLSTKFRIADPLVGLAEDALAVRVGAALSKPA